MIFILIVLLNMSLFHHCLEYCDPSYCNHEGQCIVEDNVNRCKCIGYQYFGGSLCSEVVDNCRGNPCKNGGECYNLVGQFLCRNCNDGFGGLRCDLAFPNLFQNMVLLFNHYGYYSKMQKFLILVEDLGSVPFAVELMANNYAVESFECYPQQDKSEWRYSTDLTALIKNNGLRYYNDLPFERGFYRSVNKTFWDLDLLMLSMRIYDIETASKLFYMQTFSLLIVKLPSMSCAPKLKFPHGSNPVEPLMVDIARFNTFGPVIEYCCKSNSQISFQWTIFNSLGTKALHNFGITHIPLLKIPPFRLWFNYHGEVMSSYSLVVKMIERLPDFEGVTEARCFVLVLPKPIKAIIKGGAVREIGVLQTLILNGSESRDFALASHAAQDILYRWDCKALDATTNTFCRSQLSTNRIVVIEPRHLATKATFQFTLIVQSKVNSFVTDLDRQTVVVVKYPRLFIHVQCVRNCLRHQFVSGNAIHLRIECVNEEVCSRNAKFTWIIKSVVHGSAQRFIYLPNDDDSSLIITAKVWNIGLEGTSSVELTRNLPPRGGRCSIDPQLGVAFHTLFHVHCENYDDIDTPLNYYYTAGDFPLESVNDPEAYFHMPPCNVLVVKICDQFDACVNATLSVNVSHLPEPENLTDFLMAKDSDVNALIRSGDRLTCLVLIKSIQKYLNNETKVTALNSILKNLVLYSLFEMEQWLIICYELSKNLLPLDSHKSFAMLTHFKKLTQGFATIVKDGEVIEIPEKTYVNVLYKLVSIMNDYAINWEVRPYINAEQAQTGLKTNNPLAEVYRDIPEFDIFVLEKIANWLETCKELYKYLENLSHQAIKMYYPSESAIIAKKGAFTMEIYVSEHIRDRALQIGNHSIEIEVVKGVIEYLQNKSNSRSLVLQTTSMNSNPFWWYPDDKPLATNVFHFSAFASSTVVEENNRNLPESFMFKVTQSELGEPTSNHPTEIIIRNKQHMPTLFLQLPPKAAIFATLCQPSVGVHLAIFIGKRPRGFIFRKFDSHSSTVADINRSNQQKTAYMSILAMKEAPAFPLSVTISVNIVECLHWMWDVTQPQWSSMGCSPVVNVSAPMQVKCECFHLSAFGFKNYEFIADEELNGRLLLDSLPFNCDLAAFYTTLVILFLAILSCNMHRSRHHNNVLRSSPSGDNCDVVMIIYTGSHWNAGSASSIQLRFLSEIGQFSVPINQSPLKYCLRRNSFCMLPLGSLNIQLSLKLTIVNDMVGRYPTWFCHKVVIISLGKPQPPQIFHINKWISQQSVEILPINSNVTFMESYWENLLNYYNNWFQLQPIFGPIKYTDLCRFQRSHIWMAQLMVSVCIAACVYGPTTMETYEEERELYYSLNFTLIELFTLPLVSFVSSLLVKLLFTSL